MHYVLYMFTMPRCASRCSQPLTPGGPQMSEKVPIIVMLGIDVDDKPHASRFEERDAPFVQRAAEMMGFHVIRVAPDNDELHGIAEKLPLGKIFATGRAFVPFVGRAAFDKLSTLVEGGVTITARAEAGVPPVYPLRDMFTTEAVNAADALWAKVEVGTVVLAAQPDVYGPGWWEGEPPANWWTPLLSSEEEREG